MGNAASIGRAIRADLSRTLRDVMLAAAEAVTAATPIDTTHAANNWVLSIGRPYMGVDGSHEAPSTTMQEAGIQAMQQYDIGRDGPKLYLRNNVFYIKFLDEGASDQAEPGFVSTAIRSASSAAPRGKKTQVAKMLRGMARHAYRRGH
jgi:hypothetical protein